VSRALVVLARSPCPGVGKTRLRAVLGNVVDDLAAAFLADTLAWGARAADRLLVAYRGPRQPVAQLCAGTTQLVEQTGGELGRRITGAVDGAFAGGATQVVLVGSDSPTLPAGLLSVCFSTLARAEAAIVPATDGGWVALAVRRPLGRALTGVPCSTPRTGIATTAALSHDDRAPVVLAPWYDVDDRAGLARLRVDLASGGARRAPRTAAALRGPVPNVPFPAVAS
jgi:glycosyltransferase A (GT-A) superfamily protein (DUF2064 family)